MKSIAFLAHLAILCLIPSCGVASKMDSDTKPLRKPGSLGFDCSTISPNPVTVDSFYEDNPTYNAPVGDIPWETAGPEDEDLDTDTLEKGVRALEALKYPRSFIVIRNGTIVWERYLRGGKPNHSLNVHSASKSILSAIVGIAQNQGLLPSLDTPLKEFMRGHRFPSSKQTLNLRHLLTLSSGNEWEEDETEYEVEDSDDWIQSILNLPSEFQPGAKFNYSTGDTHLLAGAFTEATGFSICEFAHLFLFKPMGFSAQRWGRDKNGFYSGGCNVYLNARALAKFGYLYLNQGEWEGTQIIPRDWVSESFTPWKKVDKKFSYGYLWWIANIDGHTAYKAWGYGDQLLYVIPSLDMVVSITSETESDHGEMDGEAFIKKYVIAALRNSSQRKP